MDRQRGVSSVSDIEQRGFIKINVLGGATASEIHRLLQKSIGRTAYSLSTVKYWVKRFQENQWDVSEGRGGAHHFHTDHDRRVEDVRMALEDKRDWTEAELAEELDIPQSTIHRILTQDLKLSKRLGIFVPHELTPENRAARIAASNNNLQLLRKHPRLLKQTLALDESWVFLRTPKDRTHSKYWLAKDEPPPHLPVHNAHGPKRMLVLALDWHGIAFWELLPTGKTVTADYYHDFLNRNIGSWLSEKKYNRVMVLHDNARPHKSNKIKEFFVSMGIREWAHPPYSPDLSPCDYGCFAILKNNLRGYRFQSWEELEIHLGTEIEEGNTAGRYTAVQKLEERWNGVIEVKGEYLQNKC